MSRTNAAAGRDLRCAVAGAELTPHRTAGPGFGCHFGQAALDLFRANSFSAARAQLLPPVAGWASEGARRHRAIFLFDSGLAAARATGLSPRGAPPLGSVRT